MTTSLQSNYLLCLLSALTWLSTIGVAPAREIAGFNPDEIVTYKKVGETSLALDVFYPEDHQKSDSTPTIIFFYAGGWAQGSPTQFHPQCEYLAARGMVAISADYRVMKRDGTTPIECLKDAKSAIRFLRKNAASYGIDPEKIAAGGGSAGGHIAAAAALLKGFNEDGEDTSTSCVPSALVLFSAVIDNSESGFGHRHVKDYWRNFSPAHNLSKSAPPTIAFFGKKDKAMAPSIPPKFQKNMQALDRRCELHLYEGATHGFYNHGKPHFITTMIEADKFLKSLGYLSGAPSQDLIEQIAAQGKEIKSKRAKTIKD